MTTGPGVWGSRPRLYSFSERVRWNCTLLQFATRSSTVWSTHRVFLSSSSRVVQSLHSLKVSCLITFCSSWILLFTFTSLKFFQPCHIRCCGTPDPTLHFHTDLFRQFSCIWSSRAGPAGRLTTLRRFAVTGPGDVPSPPRPSALGTALLPPPLMARRLRSARRSRAAVPARGLRGHVRSRLGTDHLHVPPTHLSRPPPLPARVLAPLRKW